MKYLNKTFYLRNSQGQYVGGITRVKTFVIAAFLSAIVSGCAYSILTTRSARAGDVVLLPVVGLETSDERSGESEELDETCTKTSEGYLDCTDEATRLKIYQLTDGGKKPIKWYSWDEAVKGVGGEQGLILLNVCRKYGLDRDCASTLYGMAKQESYLGLAMTGDGGHSHGWFHIMDYHNLEKSCTHDLACSAEWSLKRMLKYGYKTDPDRAVMKHNGTPGTKTTLGYLAKVKSNAKLFDQNK